jgi:hypothetical protein
MPSAQAAELEYTFHMVAVAPLGSAPATWQEPVPVPALQVGNQPSAELEDEHRVNAIEQAIAVYV